MLYILFTTQERVKFSEYIPHLLVRASSQTKARELAAKQYPRHPLPLTDPQWIRCAPVGLLLKMTPKDVPEGDPRHFELYFMTDVNVPQGDIRRLLASVPLPNRDLVAELIADPSKSVVEHVKSNGRAQVLARSENMTPTLLEHPEKSLLFVWRKVTDAWPNPMKDPNVVKGDFMKMKTQELGKNGNFAEAEADLIRRLTDGQPL